MARGGGRGVLGQEAVHHRPEERGSVLGRVVRAQLKGGLSVQYLSVIGAILVRYVSGACLRRTGNSAAHRQKHAILKQAHDI